MSESLEFLNKLIDRGVDFADAVARTTTKFDLDLDDVEELEVEYDNQF